MALELTSVALIQDYLSDTTISSATLTVFAGAAELAIARSCNRQDQTGNGAHWGTASRTEYLDGKCSLYVMLTFTPVTAVSSVSLVTSATGSYSISTAELECDGIAIADLTSALPGFRGRLGWRSGLPNAPSTYDAGWPAISGDYSRVSRPNFGDGRNRIKAVYTGGYTTIPADLSLAATILAASMYRESTHDPSVRSQSLGDFSESFGGRTASETPVLGSIEHLIGQYRRYTI